MYVRFSTRISSTIKLLTLVKSKDDFNVENLVAIMQIYFTIRVELTNMYRFSQKKKNRGECPLVLIQSYVLRVTSEVAGHVSCREVQP